ncbi:MAG: TlpA family protein disulfide reductase [Clostridiaceae bacterium]|jgi:thiol-disulfide isomerase/thioredoxin|nr:TlpA family protein disulfide reductase [Clostridiaceae bacterium]
MKKTQNRKKIIKVGVLLLALVLFFTMAGCGQKNVEKSVSSGTSESEKTTVGSLDRSLASEAAVVTDPADTSEPVVSDDPQVNKRPLFPSFTTKDLDGNKVTSDLFSENAVTVVNLWFTGCIYCVNEMPTLEHIYQSYVNEPVEFISICVDLGFAEGADMQARDIIEHTGVTYPTLWPGDVDTEFGQFLYSFFAFPTTVFVNRQGELVGQPIEGAIMGEPGAEFLKGCIDEILSADTP